MPRRITSPGHLVGLAPARETVCAWGLSGPGSGGLTVLSHDSKSLLTIAYDGARFSQVGAARAPICRGVRGVDPHQHSEASGSGLLHSTSPKVRADPGLVYSHDLRALILVTVRRLIPSASPTARDDIAELLIHCTWFSESLALPLRPPLAVLPRSERSFMFVD